MLYNMYELNTRDACRARRAFGLTLQEKEGEHVAKAAIIKSAIKALVMDKREEDEVEKELMKAFEDIPYPSEAQRKEHAKDAMRQIRRYARAENRKLYLGQTKTVSLGHDMEVSLRPDFIFYSKTEIEVIKIKASKPSITQAKANSDLGLYAMLKYAETLVPEGETRSVFASYYFLRKQNDSSSMNDPKFDDDFFNLTGGRNIVTIGHQFRNEPGFVPELDAVFDPLVQAFMNGLPEEECAKADCERCQLYEVCKFTKAPKVLVKEHVKRSMRDLELTEKQEEVIDYEKGICRVNAGAGAGKTMVVALRTAALLDKGVDPKHILLITFTNAGAEEMRNRIKLTLEDFGIDVNIDKMKICTFNAFGDEILKKEYGRLGFTEPPKVIDDVERSRIICDLLNENPIEGLDYRNFDTDMKQCRGALSVAKAIFAAVKQGQYCADDVQAVRKAIGNYGSFTRGDAIRKTIMLYDKYDERLRANNLVEYADQEVLVFELLHQDPFYMERFGFEHITVDEFQDTSDGQIELIKYLRQCPTFKSLLVIGDDSQAIFGFRNTTPEYILHFDEIMGENVDDIFLMENHRSTPEILEAANKMNEKRLNRIDKALVATRPSGKPVRVYGFLTKKEEQEFILKDIMEHLEDGTKPEDIAYIAATRYELMEMGDLLNENGIPSVLLNPEPLLENSRVQAAIALARCMEDREDTKDMLVYMNAKAEGALFKATAEELEQAMSEMLSSIDAYHALETEEDRKAYLMDMFNAINPDQDEVYQSLVDTLMTKNVSKIFEYLNDFARFGSAAAYRRTHSYPGVVLTTAHSSKGLEWPVVYNTVSKYDTQELNVNSVYARDMKEERKRLLFVSMTRARDELIITGQYVAYGKRGEYHYNSFLQDSMDCIGKGFTSIEVERMRTEREELKKLERAEAKRKEKEKKENAA